MVCFIPITLDSKVGTGQGRIEGKGGLGRVDGRGVLRSDVCKGEG